MRAVLRANEGFDIEPVLYIAPEAKLTDTYLSIKVLLLETNAKARVVPSLEIKENDVKAGHGVTIGHVDAEQLYYLMSRGLNHDAAEELLIEAFTSELANKILASQNIEAQSNNNN